MVGRVDEIRATREACVEIQNGMICYENLSTDPAFNLSVEESLLVNADIEASFSPLGKRSGGYHRPLSKRLVRSGPFLCRREEFVLSGD